MLFQEIVATSARVKQTRKRNQKIVELASTISALEDEEIEIGVGFLAGEIRQGKIGIAYANVHATRDVTPALEATLNIVEVDAALSGIGAVRGRGSSAERLSQLRRLLGRANAQEQSFIRRLLVGELRQGALESLVIEAIARAAELDPTLVRRAQMLVADLGAVARTALQEDETGLRRFDITLFNPVQPMLAHTAQGVEDALERLHTAAFELKLDGVRVQVHKDGSQVRVFTRRLNDVTDAVPEIVQTARAMSVDSMILDGETIGLRPDGSPLPFQATMRRFGRKLDVERMRRELPLTTLYFDCLYLDGESLIDAPARARASALESALCTETLVPRIVTSDPQRATAFLHDALTQGHEGVMAKSLEAPYEAGRRGSGWLKLKHVHTLDLVVLAAEWGSGRRRGWLSNLHLGARDPASGGFVMLGKTFKGMTDKMLGWQTGKLLALEVAREAQIVHVHPALVVEIAFNDVQQSPHYPGGLALRFARVKRYREDKGVGDADTIESVRALLPSPT